MEFKIRNAQFDDIDAMVALLRMLFSIESDFDVDQERQRRGVSLMLEGCGKHRCVKVGDEGGQVVGMCTAQILISTAEGGLVALIEDMIVKPGYQEKGIGRCLMAAIEDWAIKHGVTRLQLLADRNNSSASDFYDCIGWHPTQLVCWRREITPDKN
jgi:GNAT superfamily N-acetyltransferase